MPVREVARRFPRLLFGLTLFGAGIALNTPITIGLAGILVSFLVLLAWIPLRQRPGVGTLVNAIWIGAVIDLVLAVLPDVDSLWLRWPLMLAGVLVVAIGSGYYIGVRLGPGPRDGLMTGVAARGTSIRLARTAVEGSALAIGWLLGGNVGVGTLVFAAAIGPLVQMFLPRLDLGPPQG